MNYYNHWMSRESAREINDEIEFVSGKSGIPEERVLELMKIQMLNEILILLQKGRYIKMSKSKTGSENGFRVIKEPGERELPKQRAKNQAKMFQFIKSKKGGRRK